MTATADTATRANREGHPCPSWCNGGHDSSPTHVGQTGVINFGDRGLDSLWATIVLGEYHHGRPVVGVTGHRFQGASSHVDMSGYRAEGLAAIVELLADATPDQHRELAAAIRQAAAEADGP